MSTCENDLLIKNVNVLSSGLGTIIKRHLYQRKLSNLLIPRFLCAKIIIDYYPTNPSHRKALIFKKHHFENNITICFICISSIDYDMSDAFSLYLLFSLFSLFLMAMIFFSVMNGYNNVNGRNTQSRVNVIRFWQRMTWLVFRRW